MGLGRRIGQKGLHAAKALGKADHAHFAENAQGKVFIFHLEGQHCAVSAALAFHDLMTRMVFKARIDDLCHMLLCSQPFRDLHGILLGTVHTNAQSLDSPQH